ncbi:galactose-1-phosphate uridylyltransferase [Filifactor villosus]|uniref:Galactose-1-phosphate uridylyltransferase n=1 Tax=Filifactor villosus TaxID=29374 RepID=A0ABV9QNT4_9FIRM
MAELRWNPLLKDWTIVAGHRQNRPDMPKDYCPFCPGSGKVPEAYDVHKYDNDFPALSQDPPFPYSEDSALYKTKTAYGKCEVILYSPEHHASICELSTEHIKKLVDLWQERYEELSKDEKIKYIFTFENRGAEVGVTMPHPHGQIYGYSYLPLKLQKELQNSKEFYEEHKKNLFDEMNKEEKRSGKRVIFENEDFLVYLPFFTDYPYGVYIVSKSDLGSFSDFSESQKKVFSETLKKVTGMFDSLFDKKFPYMMGIYQVPVNSEAYKDAKDYYRFHIKFYPPMRGEKSIKYNASSETGAWANANPRVVEETAVELREALNKFLESGK